MTRKLLPALLSASAIALLLVAAKNAPAQTVLAGPGTAMIDNETTPLAGGGAASSFGGGAGFGRMDQPGGNFDSLNWGASAGVSQLNGALAPGVFLVQPGVPNFGPSAGIVFGTNNGIAGNFALTDPKPAGHANGVDASTLQIAGSGTWNVGAVAPNSVWIGMALGYNVVQAGNYLSAGLTGRYQVNNGGFINLTPVVFAADGVGGNDDFITAGTASSHAGGALPDTNLFNTVWGVSIMGAAIPAFSQIDFELHFTGLVDPGATMDLTALPPAAPTGDFGGNSVVPAPAAWAILLVAAWLPLHRRHA